MPSSFETLVFEIIAKDAQASAAFDRFRRTVDQTSAAVNRNSAAADKNATVWKTLAATAAAGATPALIGAGVALGGVATAAIAAGTGVATFGAFALPSITKVTTALAAPGGLAAAWGTLDNRQRVAAQGIQALDARFHTLALTMQPRVFQVFNTALGLANSLLGPLAKVAASAGVGIESFLVQFTRQSGLQQFIGFLAAQAGPAIALLGTDVTNIAHAVFALLQSFGGAGLVELKALTGVITLLTGSLTFLAQHAPGLTAVAISIGGIAFALAKLGALNAVLRLTGIATITAQMGFFAAATRGATLAERGLLATTTVLEAITPFGWAVLGAAALAGLVLWLHRTGSATGDVAAKITAQNKAVGFNTSGYYTAALAIKAYTGAQQLQVHGTYGAISAANSFRSAQNQLTQSQKDLITQGNNQQTFLTGLENKYHLTRAQAIALAGASGVLASQVNAGGQSLKNATAQAHAFADANLKAKQPVEGLKVAVTELTTAMNANVTAVLTLQGDDIAWRQAIQAATAQLKSNKAELEGNSKNALANKAAVLAATNAAVTFADDQLKLHGNLRLASQEIQAQINWLQKHGEKSKFATAEIKALLGEEAKIKAQIGTNINVTGHGSWSVVAQAHARGQGPGPFAAGGLITGGIPGRDSRLILAMPGEAVVPTHLVPAIAPFLKAHGVPGFDTGGVVGSFSGSVDPGLVKWLASENSATIHAIQASVAAATFAGMQAASRAASFGAAAGPGGGAPAANAALARRMMPAWGSGQMWAAWNAVAMAESGWNQFARNPTSGAYGIPQALPPSKMGPAANPPMSNPAAQISWMIGYIQSVYGNPIAAANHEALFHWYDHGGYLPTGLSLALNTTGHPERVGGGNTYNINVHVPVSADKAGTGRAVVEAIREFEKRSGAGWRR